MLAGLPQAKEIARRALALFKSVLDRFDEEIKNFGTAPMMSAGLVDRSGAVALYDGGLRFRDAEGAVVEDQIPAEDYATYIGEASAKDSYMKSPYFRPRGFPAGIYRVGPLARLSVADRCGTPEADKELAEFRERFGRTPRSSFLYHYARLIEALYALERMEVLLLDPRILDTHVRARAGVNALEGIGVIEAPRGTLIHHYKVNEDGGMVWANLIVATGHNALAIAGSVEETAKHFVDGGKLQEGMLNRVSAVVRAYDPCLSCSTHAGGATPVAVELRAPDGALLDEART
jgi:NAD-reducing hydrogenase large subunit